MFIASVLKVMQNIIIKKAGVEQLNLLLFQLRIHY